MQAHLRALTEAIEGWTVAGVKWALEQRGLAVGSPRPPLPPAPPAVQDRVRQVLAASRPLIDESTE